MRLLRLVVAAIVAVGVWPGPLSAHPHGSDSAVLFSGIVKKVDAQQATLVVDAVDPRSLTRGDVLVHIDSRATIRRGKDRMSLADVEPGHRVTLVGEREADEGGRIVVSDIRVTVRRR